MRSFSSHEEEDEEDRFFDTREDITSVSDSGSDCPDNSEFSSNQINVDLVSSRFQYDVWIENPVSVQERRGKFLKWLGLSVDQEDKQEDVDEELLVEIDRIREDSGAVLAHSDRDDLLSSSRSSGSCSSFETRDSSEGGDSLRNCVYRIKNLDNGTEFIVDQLGRDGMLSRLREVGSDRLLSVEEFQRSLGLTPLVRPLPRGESDSNTNIRVATTKEVKSGWLRKLGVAACIAHGQHGDDRVEVVSKEKEAKVQRVKVRTSKKRSKELSALYMGQEILAHEGSIISMKFSPDGCYLASGGEDHIVRVWRVKENERTNDLDILDFDPRRNYVIANRDSEIAPLYLDKQKLQKVKGAKKKSDSACAIFPPRVFRLSEIPVHEFHGHCGEILDLSWSTNKYLLSSSVDKTARLWRVGFEQCLGVYPHNNYVTCIQFNPMDDNYFISGSIDGKVRIWDVSDSRVVDWTDIKEIVTAVCYRPDGKGGIVGSMTGNCRFYEVKDNRLQLDAQICLQGKKKSPGKRITGFQFSPSDPSKLMVTSADSQVRILNGVGVICKFKGLRNGGSQISASFTVDGKHIVSASEDSNVYVWNNKCQNVPPPSKGKSIWSCERFFSDNVSVAVPWSGTRYENPTKSTLGKTSSSQISDASKGNSGNGWNHYHLNDSHNSVHLSPPDCLSFHQGFFSEALSRGSATWPEEKLPSSNSIPVSSLVCKTQYKFLKSLYQSTFSSNAWGMVIVTGGWDGRIRCFHNYGFPVHT